MKWMGAGLLMVVGLVGVATTSYSQSNMIQSYQAYPRYNGYGCSSPAYYNGWLPPYMAGGPAYAYTYPCAQGYCPYPPGPKNYIGPPYPPQQPYGYQQPYQPSYQPQAYGYPQAPNPYYAGYYQPYGQFTPGPYSPYTPGMPMLTDPDAVNEGGKKGSKDSSVARTASRTSDRSAEDLAAEEDEDDDSSTSKKGRSTRSRRRLFSLMPSFRMPRLPRIYWPAIFDW